MHVKSAIEDSRSRLNGKGRLVIRPSGTEPLIRVMAEGDDPAQVEAVVARICAEVEKVA
jgi:phosphoglucosamine mutase